MTAEAIYEVFIDSIQGSAKAVFNIARIVLPLMIVMEAARVYKVLDWLAERTKKVTGAIGLSGEVTFPLMVGLLFGLAYGAGVILQWAKEGNIQQRDLYLLSFFLIICHAVVEDTLIFYAIGANGILLIATRLIAAVCVTYVLSKRIKVEDTQAHHL